MFVFALNLVRNNSVQQPFYMDKTAQARHRGGAFEAFAPPENFKTLHSNFDICRNFQRIKIKFYILIIFKKSFI